jgi:dihydroorotase
MLVDNDNALERIFSNSPVLIATHCEDTPLINKNLELMREQYQGLPIPVSEHPNIRSVEACYNSSSKAVALAKKFGSKLHVLHLTTAKELSLFENKDHREKNITAEVCVHHLYFNDSDYDEFQQLIVCNPAIKTQSDQTSLMEALNNKGLDIIATDHAPHTLEEKEKAYPDCPSGLPLVQHSLLILLEFFHQGQLTLETIAAKTSHNVAEIYGIKDRGFIREDYWADLVLVNLNSKTNVSQENILYECSWSPFEDKTFNSMINKTFINGQLVYDAGNILTKPAGIRIDFE